MPWRVDADESVRRLQQREGGREQGQSSGGSRGNQEHEHTSQARGSGRSLALQMVDLSKGFHRPSQKSESYLLPGPSAVTP